MIRIGFTGPQQQVTKAQQAAIAMVLVGHCLHTPQEPAEFHHGDCIGADRIAHIIAKSIGLKIILHPPDNDSKRAFCKAHVERKPKPYLDRNHDIVDETDCLIAAPQGPEELRSGTWATVRYARKLERTIYIVWPDGRMTMETKHVKAPVEDVPRKVQKPLPTPGGVRKGAINRPRGRMRRGGGSRFQMS